MEQPQPRPSNASQKSRRREPREPAPAAPREPAPPMDDIPPAPAAPVQPSPSMGGDISAGFEGWVVPRGEVAASRMNLAFNSESVRSCRSAASISRGQWRWVIMVERIAPRVGSGSHALHFPDIGIMIGETFDPRQALRSQPNCCTWDGRDSICVNSMPIPYPRSRGGPLKDGEVIVVDLDLDARTLGFRRNGVDCGTSIRGFPGSVYLAVCGRYPTRIRWVGLSHVA
ncbi:hypothetical protein DFJ74DRAFT_657272 [Hyaloraphidium curvatum]|nr:hypothetical protein DFJ74DRAFT_657272 [Hyaloraphidium curvatum]